MAVISDRAALEAWDVGARRHALDRNLVLLAAADPSASHDTLARLDVQARDRLLLEVRRNTFGDHLELVTDCAHCGAVLDLTASASELLAATPVAAREVEVGDWRVEFRLPNSLDLAAAVETGADIFEACTRATRSGVAVPSTVEMPAEVRQAVDDAMAAAAPAADIELLVECLECGAADAISFDIGDVLWREVAARAHVLITEIVTLARFFGWTEPAILDLSPHRRRTYLEAVS